jgi:predicted permease
MPDFKAFVRAHLSSLELPQKREIKIIEELAAQLEESYESLRADGHDEHAAWTEVQRHMPDWKTIEADLLDAEPVIVRWAHPERTSFASGTTRSALSRVRRLLAAGLAGDLRSSIRLLGKNVGFTVTTVLTLAVCLGANAAVFTLVYSVLLRPLPVPDANRIVALGDVYPTLTPNDILSNTAPSFFERLEALTALEDQAMLTGWSDTIAIDGVPEEIRGMRATPSFFRLASVSPVLGRTFTADEGEIGGELKVVLSHGLWQRLYGGDPAVIGRPLRLGWTGQAYTIVGVMPRGFSFLDPDVQFWIPLTFTPAQKEYGARTRYGFYHVGRIQSGASIDQVRAQMDALNAANFKRFPELGLAELGMYTSVAPLQQAVTRPVRRTLYLLWAGAAFVLLIGAINIANLALARSSVRARELATRLALGAGTFRVTRQLLVEGILPAVVGGLGGIAVGAAILRMMASTGLQNIPNAAFIRMDWTVVGVILAIAVLVGISIGAVPAVSAGTLNVTRVLAAGSRFSSGGGTTRTFRRGLVVTQVAFSVVLLTGAALLLTSFRNLLAVDPGFSAEHVLTATIFPPPSRYKDQRDVAAVSNRVLASIRSLPGITAAGLTSNIALSGRTSPATVFAADYKPQPGEAVVLPSVVCVTPGYFEAMATPLVRGRYFSDGDRENTLPVAIVDGRLAARFWPGQDPIGKGLFRGQSQRYTIVGIVGNVRFEGLGQTESVGAVYFPHTQAPPLGRLRWLAVKTSSDPALAVRAIRVALRAIDADLPLSSVQTMTERRAGSVASQRLAMGLAGAFSLAALFLSLLGIYGVLSYVVAQRTREIGIRIALGSPVLRIFQLVFREGFTLVLAGLLIGLLGALAMGRVLEGQVFGVAPTDPFVLGSVLVSTGVVALLACVSPARRATRVDALRALNEM